MQQTVFRANSRPIVVRSRPRRRALSAIVSPSSRWAAINTCSSGCKCPYFFSAVIQYLTFSQVLHFAFECAQCSRLTITTKCLRISWVEQSSRNVNCIVENVEDDELLLHDPVKDQGDAMNPTPNPDALVTKLQRLPLRVAARSRYLPRNSSVKNKARSGLSWAINSAIRSMTRSASAVTRIFTRRDSSLSGETLLQRPSYGRHQHRSGLVRLRRPVPEAESRGLGSGVHTHGAPSFSSHTGRKPLAVAHSLLVA